MTPSKAKFIEGYSLAPTLVDPIIRASSEVFVTPLHRLALNLHDYFDCLGAVSYHALVVFLCLRLRWLRLRLSFFQQLPAVVAGLIGTMNISVATNPECLWVF